MSPSPLPESPLPASPLSASSLPASSLPESWLRGVAANPAAPSDVLIRLLAPAGRPAWPALCGERDLPADVVDAVVAHPERAVRRAFARNPRVAPAQRGRLVRDPADLVRAALAEGPRPRPRGQRPLPDAVIETLLTAEEAGEDGMLTADEIAAELISSRQIPPAFWRRTREHPRPELRLIGVRNTDWRALDPARRTALLADPDPAVREAAARGARRLDPVALEAELPEEDCHHRRGLLTNHPVTDAVAEACLTDRRDLWSLAQNRHTPYFAVVRLARDPDPEVRERVAARADVDAAVLAELAEDPDESVRTRAVAHPLPRTWAERAAIDSVSGRHAVDCDCPIPAADPWPADGPDPRWYAECAVSEHAVLRRVAATFPQLPVDLVGRLAEDPDAEVRHLLACHHPLAPPEAVLATFVARPRQRRHLLTLPGMPRTGLRHLLDHDDPEVRALAAADPSLDEPPVRLLTDPDERVRRSAAAAPTLRDEAALAALLDAPATAEGAAANPNLSARRLHELLDLAGVPAHDAPLP